MAIQVQRYICPQDGKVILTTAGFLWDPTGAYYRDSNVVSIEHANEYRLFVLLGEPGIGKSFVIDETHESLMKTSSDSDNVFIKHDLSEFCDGSDLREQLFKSSKINLWRKNSSGNLHLFLDSLDEARISIPSIDKILVSEIRPLINDRLKVWIGCRTFDWSSSSQKEYSKLYKPEEFGVFELLPLREKDVRKIAGEMIDEGKFITEVKKSGVGPLASRPITLKFLIDEFSQTRELPASRCDLYKKGCLRYCRESDTCIQRTKRGKGALSPEEVLIVAGRIAAAMIFCKAQIINTGNNLEGGGLHFDDFTGYTEEQHNRIYSITATEICQVLNTGLFSARGQDCMGWSHQSYMEFLAASYLIHRKLDFIQLKQLMLCKNGAIEKFPPCLYGIVSWLAIMDNKLMDWVIHIAPEVLLYGNIGEIDKGCHRDIFLGIYSKPEVVSILLRQWGFEDQLRKIDFPGIKDELVKIASDEAKSDEIRKLAIKMMFSQEGDQKDRLLANMLADEKISMCLKQEAVSSLQKTSDDYAISVLKNTISKDIPNDDDDELKGLILDTLWPENISIADLFMIITKPKRNKSFLGMYNRFLVHSMAEGMSEEDVEYALVNPNEIATQGSEIEGRVKDAIINKALNFLDNKKILEVVCNYFWQNISTFRPIESIKLTQETRKIILGRLIKKYSEFDWKVITYGSCPLVSQDDFDFYVEKAYEELDSAPSDIWITLADRVMDDSSVEQINKLYAVCIEIGADQIINSRFGSIELKSDKAERNKKWFYANQREDDDEKLRFEKVVTQFQSIESGDNKAWSKIILSLHNTYLYLPGSDSSFWQYWSQASSTLHKRTSRNAIAFIKDEEYDAETIDENIKTLYSILGFNTFRILYESDSGAIQDVGEDNWFKWIDTILNFIPRTWDGSSEFQKRVIHDAIQLNEVRIAKRIIWWIRKIINDDQRILNLRAFSEIDNSNLNEGMQNLLIDYKVSDQNKIVILDYLLFRNWQGGIEYAREMVSEVPIDDLRKTHVFHVINMLLRIMPSMLWCDIWKLIEIEEVFGKELFLYLGGVDRNGLGQSLGLSLDERDSGLLYEWLESRFPHEEDPNIRETYFQESRHGVTHIRDGILIGLIKTGTIKSVGILEKIAILDQDRRLNWIVEEARRNVCDKGWKQITARDFIELCSNQNFRLVQNGEQLLCVIIESLKRYQSTLHGETPAAKFLWNKQTYGTFSPKGEEDCSDHVKLFLEEDLTSRGIILNREVQIRKGGGKKGEITDIHVDAVSMNQEDADFQRVRAIIEVKASWNSELDSAIQTQLVDRYLKDNQSDHGIYLIFWMDSDNWDKDQIEKKRMATRRNMKETQEYFYTQANKLSKESGLSVKAFVIDAAL